MQFGTKYFSLAKELGDIDVRHLELKDKKPYIYIGGSIDEVIYKTINSKKGAKMFFRRILKKLQLNSSSAPD